MGRALLVAAVLVVALSLAEGATYTQIDGPGVTKTTCSGCRKDMFAGRMVYCNGYYADATVSHCAWSGGSGAGCTFTADKSVTAAECKTMCDGEVGCGAYTTYYNSICNLFFMTSCTQVEGGAEGLTYEKN